MGGQLLRIGRVRDNQKDFGRIITAVIEMDAEGKGRNVEAIMYAFGDHTRSIDPNEELKVPSKFFRIATTLLEKKHVLEQVAKEAGNSKYIISLKTFLNDYVQISSEKLGAFVVADVIVRHEFGKWEFAGARKAHFRYVCEIICDTGNPVYVATIVGAVYCSNNESKNPERMRKEFKKLAIIRAIAGLITKDNFEVVITM